MNECVSAEKCVSKEGWHPYTDPGNCLKIDPAANGGFIEREDGVYSCAGYSVEQRTYIHLLPYFGSTAKCVTTAQCHLAMQSIEYYTDYPDSVCMSRQDLLADKLINYVDLYLTGYLE